jgi:hypothetical protein
MVFSPTPVQTVYETDWTPSGLAIGCEALLSQVPRYQKSMKAADGALEL